MGLDDDERTNLTATEFYHEYWLRGRPVILRGAAVDGSATAIELVARACRGESKARRPQRRRRLRVERRRREGAYRLRVGYVVKREATGCRSRS